MSLSMEVLGKMSRKRSISGINSDSISQFGNKRVKAAQRSGKWTNEEESFANQLVLEFERGTLEDCDEGCTLRAYMARKLNCAPMRISKKFAGRCIGKLVFNKKTSHQSPSHAFEYENSELHQLEDLYKLSCNGDDGPILNSMMRRETANHNHNLKSHSTTRSQHFAAMHHSNMFKHEDHNIYDMGGHVSDATDHSTTSSSDEEHYTVSPFASVLPQPAIDGIASYGAGRTGLTGVTNVVSDGSSMGYPTHMRPSPSHNDLTSLMQGTVDDSFLPRVESEFHNTGGEVDTGNLGTVEADEWRDVLAFFCGEDDITRSDIFYSNDVSPSSGSPIQNKATRSSSLISLS